MTSLFSNLCTHCRDDAQRHTAASMGGVHVESKPGTAIHRPEENERLPPGTEPDQGRLLLRQKNMSDWLVPEKSVPQPIHGSHVVFCGVAFSKFVDQRGHCGNVTSSGAAHNNIVHSVHAIAESRKLIHDLCALAAVTFPKTRQKFPPPILVTSSGLNPAFSISAATAGKNPRVSPFQIALV